VRHTTFVWGAILSRDHYTRGPPEDMALGAEMRCSPGFISLVTLDARALDSDAQPNANVQLPAKSVHHDAAPIGDFYEPFQQLSFRGVRRDA